MATEQKESDKDTIKKVYNKYIEEYNCKPHSPDVLRRFAQKFHDVHISFASAKAFLNTKTLVLQTPNFGKMISSISTPNVLTYSNIEKKKKLKSSLNEKYDNVNNLQLLKNIKDMIMNLEGIKDNNKIISSLNDTIFHNADSEYFELMKRLSSSKLNDIGVRKLYSKDENFLSLKSLTERVDVDDVDHDAAMFLLRNYYDSYDNDENVFLYDHMILKYREQSSVYSGPTQLTVQHSAPNPLTLSENITPDFLMSNAPPILDKGFRALSTVATSISTLSPMTSISMGDDNTMDNTMDNTDDKMAIPQPLMDKMSKYDSQMDNWDFDVFEFMDDPIFCGKGLVYLSFYLFRKVGLLDGTGVSQSHLWRFLESVDNGYTDTNPYHNKYHAVDVLLNTHFFFEESQFMKSHMTQWDRFGAYIAGLCHDLGHMGFNNNWYVNTTGNLALLYGNESVLENYHLNETFRLLNKPLSNWMLSFTSSIRKYLSIVIKHSIIATDVKHHGMKVHQLQNMINVFKKENNNFNIIKLQKCESVANYASVEMIKKDGFKLFINDAIEKKFDGDIMINDIINDEKEDCYIQSRIGGVLDERLFIIGLTIHACDVANPCKPLKYAMEWAKNYIDEAYNQGDTEKTFGIPVSPGMDRNTTKLPHSQIGFISYIVKKLFQLFAQLINSDGSKKCLEYLDENEKYWIQQKKESITYKIAKVPDLKTITETSAKGKTVTFSDHEST